MRGQRFDHGQLSATPGALDALENEGENILAYFIRHLTGDWGDVPPEDRQENELSIREGYRIMSAYTLPKTQVKIWVIAEADRSATTVLLPEEY